LQLWVPTDAIVVDLNGDDRADLVMLASENQALVMYQSATVAGSFTAPQPLR
jgi:hypothetical protein